ncbi:hypothetical protein ACJEDT_02740 [Rhodococcoides fascians]|uniref:hypothetical protein n=1 Tax=Rhodococcoides fascians TaxID=1828 RepID=UPI00050CCFA6|nr:hypothetical protein [Rhodococcus fascians]
MPSPTSPFDPFERLGTACDALQAAVVSAARQAHEHALGSHEAQAYRDRDTYAAALRVNLHKLLADKVRDIPGVVLRKPENTRSRFDLPFVQEKNVVLHWWKYATDGRTRREDARIAVSGLREHLMTLAPTAIEDQLAFDSHGTLSEEEIQEQFEQDAHFNREMAKSGRSVTLAIASSPDGLFDLGWGDAELADESGRVIWSSWQSLKSVVVPSVSVPRIVETAQNQPARFDDGATSTSFDLALKTPSTDRAGGSELRLPPTGSDDAE